MKAICLSTGNSVQVRDCKVPEHPVADHLIVNMQACGVNPGDVAFINGVFPPGSIPVSHDDICGVSGVGTVIAIGEGVPHEYLNRKVTVYRSLRFSPDLVGTWSEYAQLHHLHCVILPSDLDAEEYAGSLVNIITPYAFLKQIVEEGHKGIIATAGNSATGMAMLGISQFYDFPLISIVRTEGERKLVESFGAKHILVQSDNDFKKQLASLSQELGTTAVFDGVGGSVLNNIFDALPFGTSIYCYGFLGGQTPLSIHTSAMMRNITLKGFGNFRSRTVQDSALLKKALADIGSFLHLPHFKTRIGKKFSFADANAALTYTSTNGGKAILYP